MISDGLATDLAGRDGVDDRTIAAAQAIADARDGEVCFHTIQSGAASVGAACSSESPA